jgi:hypothetical protein
MKTATTAVIILSISMAGYGSTGADRIKPLSSHAVQAGGPQLAVYALYYAPDDDDVYDYGLGAELQFRHWITDRFGLALAGGVANWETKDQNVRLEEGGDIPPPPDPPPPVPLADGDPFTDIELDGSVLLLPIGGSILYRPVRSDSFSITLEGGIRYIIVESSVDASIELFDGTDTLFLEDELKIDDGMVGVVAADAEARLTPSFRLIGGIGYQFDLIEGDVKLQGEKFGDNELNAFFVRAGFAIDF